MLVFVAADWAASSSPSFSLSSSFRYGGAKLSHRAHWLSSCTNPCTGHIRGRWGCCSIQDSSLRSFSSRRKRQRNFLSTQKIFPTRGGAVSSTLNSGVLPRRPIFFLSAGSITDVSRPPVVVLFFLPSCSSSSVVFVSVSVSSLLFVSGACLFALRLRLRAVHLPVFMGVHCTQASARESRNHQRERENRENGSKGGRVFSLCIACWLYFSRPCWPPKAPLDRILGV